MRCLTQQPQCRLAATPLAIAQSSVAQVEVDPPPQVVSGKGGLSASALIAGNSLTTFWTAGSTDGTHERAEVQQAPAGEHNSSFPRDAAASSRSVAASVSSSPTNRSRALLPALHPAMQKGICYDNEVFLPPDKQPTSETAAVAAASGPRRTTQQTQPLEEELLADMQCLDQGVDHMDSLLQERLCLPRLNTLKRYHGSSQHVRSFDQQDTGRNLTSSSRTASATLSEGDGAGDWPCNHVGKQA